jgi:osmotically inducible protein OsmC
MPTRTAEAEWQGDLKSGSGRMKTGSGAFEGPFSFRTRFEDEPGTNPEELIGAAHAGCFSMAFSHGLAQAGYTPTRVHTTAKVHFGQVDGGFAITKVELTCEAVVPGISEGDFRDQAEIAKLNCPVSKALLPNVAVSLDAKLVQ